MRIAKFEENGGLEQKLSNFQNSFNISSKNYIDNLLSQMKVIEIPKSYGNKYIRSNKSQVLSNLSVNFPFELTDTNFVLDAPIEIHIISVLWIQKEGYKLQESYDRYNYGYKLSLDDEGNVSQGLRLYDKYYENYQKWRDNSIDTAKSLLEKKQDSTIIQLDIKKYFHNISLDFTNVKTYISNETPFTELLETVHKKYYELLNSKTDKFSPKRTNTYPLPIGLLSSGILSNWHLDNFDKKVSEKLSPAFYGRYVDDIIIVLANTPIKRKNNENDDLDNFIHEYFVKRDLFEPKSENNGYNLKYNQNSSLKTENLFIQEDKLSILEFSHTESLAALNNFIKKLKETSSIFWLLPEDEKDGQDFDKNANDLIYTDSINKLRSLNNILPSKFGASVFLAKRILSSLLADEEPSKRTDEQILTFFKNKLSLEFYHLWEKVSTYFVINNKKKELFKFIDLCKESIFKSYKQNKNEDVKIFLLDHLKYCIAISASLTPNLIFEEDSYLYRNFKKLFDSEIINSLIAKSNLLRQANLIRHNYISFPLLNFTKYSSEFNSPFYKPLFFKNEIKFIEKELSIENIELEHNKYKFSPRYINFFECNIHMFFSSLITEDKIKISSSEILLNDSFELYYKINYSHRTDLSNSFKENYRSKLFNTKSTEENKILEVNLETKVQDKFSIAVANHKIHSFEIESSIKNKLVFSNIKKNNLVRILNQTEEEKADILLLPEITIPFKWLIRISDESRRKQRAIIGGLEHFSINRYCYNYLITILPIEINGIKECIIIPRLKNYYSPEEDLLIKSIRYKVPSNVLKFYNLFKWKGLSFTVFNCYELASVNDRSLFVSKVDAIFASEFNKDWKYFSNIAESISRDVHCYYIQSNTSDIGDSRIIQPTSSNDKDILRLKGGNKSSVLTGTIDILKLRDFQEKEYFRQKELKTFKPTPPLFNKENVNKR